MAFHDPLTGLANRSLLGDRIGQACARADRGGRPPCVFLLDLDEFKTINDGLGHGAGDVILVEVARRLTGVVRATDTVGRLGGDEFAVLMLEVTEDEALRIAQRALQEMQRPFTVGEPHGVGRRQHRVVPRPARSLRRPVVAGRRHRNVRGQGRRAGQRPGVPAADAPRRQRATAGGVGVGCRDHRGATHPALPADGGAGHRAHHRRRGTGPLAASPPRPAAAGELHFGGRGQRAHHRARALGPAVGDRPAPLLAAPAAGRRFSCTSTSPRSRFAGRGWPPSSPTPLPSTGSRRTSWPWRSPRPG